MPPIVLLVGQRSGHPMPTLAGIALLYGVPEADLEDCHPRQLPEEWRISAGRRRDEALAAMGPHDVFSALAYWAAKDLGKSIVVCDNEALLGMEAL